MERLAHFEELRIAYDRAFERLKVAERRTREAELAYRQRRDELAQFILDQQGHVVEEVEQFSASSASLR